ncbi:MAG: heme exporter protein CcmD [Alphaproteobacteria bacterium]|nr:heme exporter protein CcmD [Candidatus Odyssella sp.]
MDGIGKFLEMGGYAAYVWPALGLTVLVLAGLLVASVKSVRRREAELARLEAEAGRGDEG